MDTSGFFSTGRYTPLRHMFAYRPYKHVCIPPYKHVCIHPLTNMFVCPLTSVPCPVGQNFLKSYFSKKHPNKWLSACQPTQTRILALQKYPQAPASWRPHGRRVLYFVKVSWRRQGVGLQTLEYPWRGRGQQSRWVHLFLPDFCHFCEIWATQLPSTGRASHRVRRRQHYLPPALWRCTGCLWSAASATQKTLLCKVEAVRHGDFWSFPTLFLWQSTALYHFPPLDQGRRRPKCGMVGMNSSFKINLSAPWGFASLFGRSTNQPLPSSRPWNFTKISTTLSWLKTSFFTWMVRTLCGASLTADLRCMCCGTARPLPGHPKGIRRVFCLFWGSHRNSTQGLQNTMVVTLFCSTPVPFIFSFWHVCLVSVKCAPLAYSPVGSVST